MARDLFTNQASTTVAASKTAPAAGTTESWTVASSSAFPTASNSTIPPTQFYVADPAAPTELILVTNVSGTTWSVTRGADGTTPVSHSAGFTIKNVVPAKWLQRLEDRLKKDEFNVLDFGAVGDDSTDCYAGIQAALNAARDAGGGTVYIPKGNYRFQTTPFKIYEGTHIVAHPKAHIKNYAGTDASLMWNGTGGDSPSGYNGNGNITIEGGIWDQRGVSVNGAACFSFAHGKNITFQNLTVRDVRGTHAIEVNGCQTVRVLNCRFEGFYDNLSGTASSREYSEAVQLDLMKSSSVYGAFGAYDHTPCDDVVVDGCVFTVSDTPSVHQWGRGVGTHNGTIGKYHTNIRIVNNHFNVLHDAVRGYSWKRAVISNNTIEDCGNGITFQAIPYMVGDPAVATPSEDTKNASGVQTSGSQPVEDFTITGNIITGTQSGETPIPAIYIHGDQTGPAYNGTITGNVINGSGTTSIQVNYGNRVNISNNTIYDAGLYGILVKWSNDCTIANNTINTTDDTALMTTLGTNHLVSGNFIRFAGERGIYISGDEDTVVSNNYIFGASRNNATGVQAMYSDGTTNPVTWIGNVVRKVGSGNEYTYAFQPNNGTHYVKGNDLEIGKTGRINIASSTIQGMTSVTFYYNGTFPASGTNFGTAATWTAPSSGYLKRFMCQLGSGSCTMKLTLNGAELGTTVGATSTAYNGANQTIEYEAGDVIGLHRDNAGTSPATSVYVTLYLIENGSNL